MALIILGHPDFNKSVANRTIIEELLKSSIKVEVRNLKNLYPDFKIDVVAEQEALMRHRTIVFQYPFFWYSMPAILKHWFDMVFEHQFAYGSHGDKLKGKYFVPSFTVGSSESSYTALGFQHFRVWEFCKHLEQTAYHTQMNFIDPIYFHGSSYAAGFLQEDIQKASKQHAFKLLNKIAELEEISF